MNSLIFCNMQEFTATITRVHPETSVNIYESTRRDIPEDSNFFCFGTDISAFSLFILLLINLIFIC
jgi:hypothetical protein